MGKRHNNENFNYFQGPSEFHYHIISVTITIHKAILSHTMTSNSKTHPQLCAYILDRHMIIILPIHYYTLVPFIPVKVCKLCLIAYVNCLLYYFFITFLSVIYVSLAICIQCSIYEGKSSRSPPERVFSFC